MARKRSYTIKGIPELKAAFQRLDRATKGKILENAVRSGANPILNDAIPRAPVVTGNLRRSLHIEIVNASDTHCEAEIGTDVEYASYVEFGTARQTAKPYLRPAFDTQVNTAKQEIADALKAQIEAAI